MTTTKGIQMDSIYDHPTVKPLWDEYCRRTTLAEKDEIMPELMKAVKQVQMERGQRTRWNYTK